MIAKFYENSEIFITGGSGVVGKAAIEKLLRSCNVKRIYVLLRNKKGLNTEDRLVDLKKSKIFKVLKERKPNELDKLVAISGNTSLEGLGISAKDREKLENVSIFIHSAASTRFDASLKIAILLNVRSTLEALKLAETMKNLKIFTHVSTYFSNPYEKYVEDKIYPALFDWKTALKILDADVNDDILYSIQNKVIQGFPNTYLFTKHLAEQLVNDYRFKLPVAIFKPSIVIGALEEPEPGFTETMTGIMAMLTVWGTGLLQGFYVNDPYSFLDMTPLDLGTKTLLMFTALKSRLPREKFIEATPIAKFSSISITGYSLSKMCQILTKAVHKNPLEKSFWIPNVTITSSSFLFSLILFFMQIVPSILVDVLLRIFGKKPFMMQIQRKIYVTRNALDFFISTDYRSDGITDFEEMFKIGEGTDFNLNAVNEYGKDLKQLRKALTVLTYGVRKFIMNEPDSSVEQCRRILKLKEIAYNIIRGIAAFIVCRAIFRVVMARIS